MNIFRIAGKLNYHPQNVRVTKLIPVGDLSHLISILILLHKMRQTHVTYPYLPTSKSTPLTKNSSPAPGYPSNPKSSTSSSTYPATSTSSPPSTNLPTTPFSRSSSSARQATPSTSWPQPTSPPTTPSKTLYKSNTCFSAPLSSPCSYLTNTPSRK